MNFSRSYVLRAAALVSFAAVCGCGGDDGSKSYAEAEAAYGVRNLEKAAKLFEKSLQKRPDHVDTLVALTRVRIDLGQIDAAGESIRRAAGLSDDIDVRMLSAQVAWYAKDIEAATKGFTAIANDARQPPEIRAQAWSGLGVVEMSRERIHFARIAFLRALRFNFKDAAARYHLGLLYRDAFSYYEAALEQFQVFVHLETDATPRVQTVQRTFIPGLKAQIAQAAADRPGAAKRNSSAAAAALTRAVAAEKKGRIDDARFEYAAALNADPLSYPAALGLAVCWQKTPASKKRGMGNPQAEALKAYKKACSLQPGKVSTFVTTGNLALRLGHYAVAAEVFSRAIAASPTSLSALDGLIQSLGKQGKNEIAKEYRRYRESIPGKKK